MTRFSVPALLVCLPFWACDAGGEAQGFTVSTEGGRRLVESSEPAWSVGEEWHLGNSPALSIGVVDGDEAYLLDRVVGAATLSDGSTAVLDIGSSRIRLFDGDGRFQGGFGSKGPGPEEFRQVLGIRVLEDDSLAVVDRLERVHIFTRNGRRIRSVALESVPLDIDPLALHETGQFDRVVGFLMDGSLVTRRGEEVRLSEDRRLLEAQAPSVVFSLRAGDGDLVRTLLEAPGRTYAPHPADVILPLVFGPALYAAARGHDLIVADARTAEVGWYDETGVLRQVASRRFPTRAVTKEMVEQHVRGSSPPIPEALVRDQPVADVLSPFSGLLVDDLGNAWVRHYQVDHANLTLQYIRTYPSASRWSVFGSSGEWLGDVDMPPFFTPIEIGARHVLGLARDEFDVERVVRYDLVKP